MSAFPICLPTIWQNVKRRARREHHSSPTPVPCWFGAKRCHRGVEGRRWWCFSDWICILRMRDFFCSNRTLSVSVVWVLFVHDDNQVLAPWPTIWGIYRERERELVHTYIHIYTPFLSGSDITYLYILVVFTVHGLLMPIFQWHFLFVSTNYKHLKILTIT